MLALANNKTKPVTQLLKIARYFCIGNRPFALEQKKVAPSHSKTHDVLRRALAGLSSTGTGMYRAGACMCTRVRLYARGTGNPEITMAVSLITWFDMDLVCICIVRTHN